MNIEDYRGYCLSLGEDVEEKLPFTAFHYASGVLVFYVQGHMFSFFDCDNYSVITLKCQPERIEELKAHYDCIGKPFRGALFSSRFWRFFFAMAFNSAGAGLWDWGASWSSVSGAPWRIPLRTALV